jgi:hypothetical protein
MPWSPASPDARTLDDWVPTAEHRAELDRIVRPPEEDY